MPVQKDVWVTGRFGPVLFYQSGGKFIARSLPKKVKKTKNMKARSTGFGVASRLAGHIRRELSPAIINKSNRIAQAQLSGAFSKWIERTPVKELESTASIPFVDQFYFQRGYFGLEMWINQIIITEKINEHIITIPEVNERMISRDISNVRKIVFSISATTAKVQTPDNREPVHESFEYTVPIGHFPSHELRIPVTVLPGHIFVIVTSVDVLYTRIPSDKKRIWGACKILRACYSSISQE